MVSLVASASLAGLSPLLAQSSTVGQWSSQQTWSYRAIHAQLLPTGKVMFWDSYADADHPHLWDPATGSITAATPAGYNIFCTGFSLLANGRLFVAGGHISDNVGLATAAIYDPFTNSWTRLPNMNAGRWYPTATTLPGGDALVVAGTVNTSSAANLLPQVWQPSSGTWRNLTSAQLSLPYYPYMFVAPNGQVFNAGPSQLTRYLNTAGTGAWTTVGNNLYGTRNWGSAVMYDAGKVLLMGGTKGAFYAAGGPAVAPTNTAEVIDLTAASPAWRATSSMALARKQHNATLLPDGRVLVTGGSSGNETATAVSSSPARTPEIWDPATGAWTTVATEPVFRGYHSVSLLLPDGRVLSAGGNFEATAGTYSPPYLFQGARPTISSAPASVSYGQTFLVGTSSAASIAKVTWLRLANVTHTNNMGQRFNRLTFSPTTGGVNVTAPGSRNVCPPGYYMLFLINGSGVPSVARIVRIDGGAAPPTPTRTATRTSTPAATAVAPTRTATRTLSATASRTPTRTATRTASRTATRTATATASRTATRTATRTPTASRTATRTATRTLTASRTPTITATRTASRTSTATASVTRTPSRTSTITPTATATFTATRTRTNTATPSRTATATATASSTRTNTASPTRTATASATPTQTATATPSRTPTIPTFTPTSTRTATSTSTATPTVTPSATATASPTSTPTASPTATPTATATATPSDTPTPSPTVTATVTPSPSPTPSPTATDTPTATATPTASPTETPAPTDTPTPTATEVPPPPTPTPTPTDTPQLTETPTATLPTPPSGLTATPGALVTITLSWTDNANDEDGSIVERCVGVDCVDFVEIARFNGGSTSYTDLTLLPLTTYTYRVRAFNAAGASAPSNTASAEPGL